MAQQVEPRPGQAVGPRALRVRTAIELPVGVFHQGHEAKASLKGRMYGCNRTSPPSLNEPWTYQGATMYGPPPAPGRRRVSAVPIHLSFPPFPFTSRSRWRADRSDALRQWVAALLLAFPGRLNAQPPPRPSCLRVLEQRLASRAAGTAIDVPAVRPDPFPAGNVCAAFAVGLPAMTATKRACLGGRWRTC